MVRRSVGRSVGRSVRNAFVKIAENGVMQDEGASRSVYPPLSELTCKNIKIFTLHSNFQKAIACLGMELKVPKLFVVPLKMVKISEQGFLGPYFSPKISHEMTKSNFGKILCHLSTL